jgi:hypothetical protein
MMLITVNTHPYIVEAASAAPTTPCRQKLGDGRRFGNTVALARRCAR